MYWTSVCKRSLPNPSPSARICASNAKWHGGVLSSDKLVKHSLVRETRLAATAASTWQIKAATTEQEPINAHSNHSLSQKLKQDLNMAPAVPHTLPTLWETFPSTPIHSNSLAHLTQKRKPDRNMTKAMSRRRKAVLPTCGYVPSSYNMARPNRASEMRLSMIISCAIKSLSN